MKGLFNKDTVVLDVTSRLMSAIVGAKKAQSVFDIKACVEREYDGYADGEFFDADSAARAAKDVLEEAVSSSRTSCSKVYIGVPGEFVSVMNNPVSITLDRVRRIVDDDIDFLIDKGNDTDDPDYVLINASAMCYSVDTSDKLYFDVRGMSAGRVSATVSYMYAQRNFTELFADAARRAGFKEVRFVAVPWAEGIAMFEREQRDATYILVDAGYISTSISVGRGEGLSALRSFSMGGGHIAADIFEVLDVPFELAERASELVDLNLTYAEDAVLVADGEHVIYAAEASEIVKARLDYFAEIVKGALDGLAIPDYVPVWLTGEGIATMRGAKTFLADRLGRPVEVVAPRLPGFAKSGDSSKVSLLILAETLSKSSFGGYIKSVFNGGKK